MMTKQSNKKNELTQFCTT